MPVEQDPCPACGAEIVYSSRKLYIEGSERTIGRLHTWTCQECPYFYNYKMSEFDKKLDGCFGPGQRQ